MTIYEKLKSELKGRVIFVGVGNVLKGDDGAGVVLVNMLKKKFKDAGSFLDCGIAPENYLEKLRGFDCVVIFDALDFGGKTGEITILKPKELSEASVSTHNLSLKLFSRYLEEDSINVIIAGIQPANLRFAEGLSKVVSLSLKKFVHKFPPFN